MITREHAIENLARVMNDLDVLANDCTHLTHADISEWANDMRNAYWDALLALGIGSDVTAKQNELFPDDDDAAAW